MIGQKNVLNRVDNLIKTGFPRFVVIIGAKGQGKTELAKYISKKLNIQLIEIGIKIDDIREMITMSYKHTNPIIYLIQNADKMSINAQNSLLKIIEEPPNNAYFIMELQQLENTLETIKSRCQEIKMDNYTEDELNKFITKISPTVNNTDRVIYKLIATNYYQLELLKKYGIQEFYSYVQKVADNIYKVSSANSFKLTEKLDLKNDGNGYDLNLFLSTYEFICMQHMVNLMCMLDRNALNKFKILTACVNITFDYKQKLRINRNK